MSAVSKEDDPRVRAEDIILGAQGYGEAAKLTSICLSGDEFHLFGCWDDGDEFKFTLSSQELEPLEKWAIEQLLEDQKLKSSLNI